MSRAAADCQCEKRGFPLPSLCDDDLFCPQCGGAVAWLHSPAEQPSPQGGDDRDPTFWVYPTRAAGADEMELTFSLEFRSLDRARREQIRPLSLDPRLCTFQAPNWFEAGLDIRPSAVADGLLECRLRPNAQLVQRFGREWHRYLPDVGVSGQLTLVGNCGTQRLALWVFNEPEYEVEVVGEGVQPEPPGATRPEAWGLWRKGKQKLAIRVRPTNACISLPRLDADPEQLILPPDAGFRVERRLALGSLLTPEQPGELVLECDTSMWPQDQRYVVTLMLYPAILLFAQFDLTFFRQSQGELAFPSGNKLELDRSLHFGELVESSDGPTKPLLPFFPICNRGEGVLRVTRPVVEEHDGPPGLEWLRVSWERGDDEMIELEPSDPPSRLRLVIDLSRLRPGDYSPLRPLTALVRIEHFEYQTSWTFQVVVPRVDVQPPLRSYLAIDFGNSNTYAAIVDQNSDGPDARIRPVLDEADPENFASALYFTSVADPDDPNFVIGREALQLGEFDAAGLFRGLKRYLLDDQDYVHIVRDRANNPPLRLSRVELIRLFLEGVLAVCERRERQTVTRLGLSYPANFSPRARAKLDQVIVELQGRWAARHPHHAAAMQFEALSTDEASAVALGFVLNRGDYEAEIRPLLEQGRNSFLAASFDFGGGSIDCALMGFERLRAGPILRYRSQHFGIGGDERFGGDNVTVAVAELLRDRLRVLITQAESDMTVLPLARPDDSRYQFASPTPWDNYQALWDAAEQVKRYLCLAAPAAADEQRVRNALTAALNRLHVERKGRDELLAAGTDLESKARRAIESGGLLMSLDEVYDHRVERDFAGRSGYTVRERLTRCVRKLSEFAARLGPEAASGPDFVVLAGAGCRLPLVRAVLASEFPHTRLINDPSRPKSKVATGLMRYLDLKDRFPDRAAPLSLASDYTHAAIVWCENEIDAPFVWVPSCVSLHDGAWHVLEHVGLTDCWNSTRDRKVRVYRDTAPRVERIGEFDLSVPAPSAKAGWKDHLPDIIPQGAASAVALRLGGDEERLFLKVTLDGEEYGEWPLEPVM